MARGKRVAGAKAASIKLSILEGKLDFHGIARKHQVNYSSVNKIYHELKLEKFIDPEKVHGEMSKTDAYFTEEEMLSSPFYNATNREKITPIRKDWKLY